MTLVFGVAMCTMTLQGCGDTTLLRYSQNLADKAKGSSAQVEKFYGGLQTAHSAMRLEELKLQADAATPLDPASPGPLCPFTPEDVANRVRAAKFIETYSVKMNDLVRSKSPNEMESAISDVSAQLSGFDIKNFNPLSALQSASTPITTALKLVGRRGFAAWADRWLKDALAKSDNVYVEQTKQLSYELKADTDEAATRATALQGRAERVYRKRAAAHVAEADLKAAMDEVERVSTFRQQADKDNPSKIYDDLLEAHAQLMTRVPIKAKK